MYFAAKAGIMDIIAYATIAYLVFQLIVSLINIISGQYLKKGELEKHPFISILIPARNEEDNIGILLDDLYNSAYQNFEILIYDDESIDQTASIVNDKCLKDNRIRYLQGNGLPKDWIGKNHACHQLARQAKGDYLLFMDADVHLLPTLLIDSLAFLQKHDLELLSIFPVQEMKTLGEWLTVPLMNRILVGNLPLIMIRRSPMPAFSAANGQFMLFKAETYKKNWFHYQVRNEKTEDIHIIRRMKKQDYKVHTLLSGGQISCRMYKGFGEGLDGFSKNINAFFGKNWLILFLYVFLTTIGPFSVWLAFSIKALIIYLAAIIILKTLISLQSHQYWLVNAVLIPFQQVSLILIAILAAYRQLTGNLYWKGRGI